MPICSKCEEWLEKSDFYADKRASTGLRSNCKACHNKPAPLPPKGVTHKKCVSCKKNKPLEAFYKNKLGQYQKASRCNKCYIVQQKDWRGKRGRPYKDYQRDKSARFRKKYPDRVLEYDSYIVKSITGRSKDNILTVEDVPQELIEEKRNYLKMLREYNRKLNK